MIFSSIDGLLAVDQKRRVLVDGCFDPLHAGHVRYLRAAKRSFPDYELLVTVASDEDISAKGREPLFPQMTRCATVDGLSAVDIVCAKDRPMEAVIAALMPYAYVKGADWTDRLPDAQIKACAEHGVQIVFLNTQCASSSDALRRWALRDAERGLDRLEAFMATQQPATEPWQPVTDYSFEARRKIEGLHPQLIKEAFDPLEVLDVGAGPGHLMRLLSEVGVWHVCGIDTNPANDTISEYDIAAEDFDANHPDFRPRHDLVICREVLEHLTVTQIARAVANLFRLSSRFVYITTRFTDKGVFDAATDFDTDPTHITCLSQPFLRALCVLNGGKRRRDLEAKLDHMKKGRVLVYEIA